MPLCPAGQKTIIGWQYPGEDKQRIIGADDYSISVENGKGGVGYHVFGTYYSRNYSSGGCNVWGYWRTTAPVIGTQVFSYEPVLDSANRWAIKLNTGIFRLVAVLDKQGYDSNFLINFSGSITNLTSGCRNDSAGGYGDRLFEQKEKRKIIRADGQPDNAPCTLTITRNGQTVHKETRAVCPQVSYSCGEQCPPGSCECMCGTKVCCHDPNTGAVIKSFTRS